MAKDEYILVVDDDWMNREVIEAYLARDGHVVRSVNNGHEAIKMAKKQPPALVLLDVNMPGMNGYEVCEALKNRRETRFTPVMFITALESDEDKVRAIEAGADDFLTKPFNSLVMLTRVKSLIRIRRLHEEVEDRNRLLRQILNRYVSEEVTGIILTDPEKYMRPGGDNCLVTVFFADIRGFTSFAEQTAAQDVLTTLNEIFNELTDCVFHHHGTFDKFIGDEIMGFFGAPVPGEDDAFTALKMALEMQSVFQVMRRDFKNPLLHQLGLGIGLHTGEAAVGNVGNEKALNYTAIGDTVNVARRLQQSAGHGEILISDATLEAVQGRVEVATMEPIYAQGKSEPITAYRLVAVRE